MRTYVLYIVTNNGIEVSAKVQDNNLIRSCDIDLSTVPSRIKERIAMVKLLEIGSASTIGFRLHGALIIYLNRGEYTKLIPESKVKSKVKKMLAEHGAYYFMPATHGYGSSGVPDIVACLHGKFLGIECKANGGKPTALQMKNLRELSSAGGIAVLVDETGFNELSNLLTGVNKLGGCFINASRTKQSFIDPST